MADGRHKAVDRMSLPELVLLRSGLSMQMNGVLDEILTVSRGLSIIAPSRTAEKVTRTGQASPPGKAPVGGTGSRKKTRRKAFDASSGNALVAPDRSHSGDEGLGTAAGNVDAALRRREEFGPRSPVVVLSRISNALGENPAERIARLLAREAKLVSAKEIAQALLRDSGETTDEMPLLNGVVRRVKKVLPGMQAAGTVVPEGSYRQRKWRAAPES